MLDEPRNSPFESAGPGGPGDVTAPVTPSEPGERRSSRKRRSGKPRKHWSWKRWLANLMILAGILFIPGYYLGTCAYTALQQQGLRQDLVAANPQLASSNTALTAADFIPMEVKAQNAVEASATAAEIAAAEAAVAAAEAERKAQLEAFKAAADAYVATVSVQTGTPIGKIVIPSIGVDVVMVEGTSKGDLKEGPGHWAETPFPGQGGQLRGLRAPDDLRSPVLQAERRESRGRDRPGACRTPWRATR